MMVSMIVLLVVLGASMLLQTFWAEQANNIFLAAMVVLFIGLFVSSNGQQKRLRSLVQEENKKATELIKNELGEAAFQEILDNQEKYYQKYFNTEEEIETPTESNDEQEGLEALEAFQEDEKADVEDKE
jgi:hypothetical protein